LPQTSQKDQTEQERTPNVPFYLQSRQTDVEILNPLDWSDWDLIDCGYEAPMETFETKRSSAEHRDYGVRATRFIANGQFICEYRGELVKDMDEMDRREAEYNNDSDTVGSYTFYFRYRHRPRRWCIDPTRAEWHSCISRYFNSSYLHPNLEPSVLNPPRLKSGPLASKYREPKIILKAIRDIEPGEELVWFYGVMNEEELANNPWLMTT